MNMPAAAKFLIRNMIAELFFLENYSVCIQGRRKSMGWTEKIVAAYFAVHIGISQVKQ